MALLHNAAHAQQATTWYHVTYVQLRPDLLTEYLELQRQEVNPALQKAGVPWRSAWRTGEFGNAFERVFVTPVRNFSEYDSEGPLSRGMDARKLERLQDRLRRCTLNRQTYGVRYRGDLSVESDRIVERSIAAVTTLQVAPGRTAQWEKFLEESLPKFRSADMIFGVYQRVFGPGPTSWQIVENLRSHDELDRPGILTRAFGAEVDRMAASLAGVLVSVERTVLLRDTDLSYEQNAPTSQQSTRD
jgi:hypothetical protein